MDRVVPSLLALTLLSACAADTAPPSEPADASPAARAPETDHGPPQAPDVGDTAPGFSLTSLDGEVVDIDRARADRPVVLMFGSFS